MKSGTTFLDNLVREHPQIEMPVRSTEFSFFDNDNIYKKGINWYETLFEALDSSLVIGQTSADCAFNPGSLERIKTHLPNVKLIFILRDPLKRAYSLYWHQVKMGREFKSFEKVIELENKRIKKDYYSFKMYSYIGRSQYAKQVEHIKALFPANQLLFVPFEILIKNRIETLNIIFSFLGVNRVNSLEELNIGEASKNTARVPSSMIAVWFSSILQRMGFVKMGRHFLKFFLTDQKTPEIKESTRAELELKLKEDIRFHKELLDSWSDMDEFNLPNEN